MVRDTCDICSFTSIFQIRGTVDRLVGVNWSKIEGNGSLGKTFVAIYGLDVPPEFSVCGCAGAVLYVRDTLKVLVPCRVTDCKM